MPRNVGSTARTSGNRKYRRLRIVAGLTLLALTPFAAFLLLLPDEVAAPEPTITGDPVPLSFPYEQESPKPSPSPTAPARTGTAPPPPPPPPPSPEPAEEPDYKPGDPEWLEQIKAKTRLECTQGDSGLVCDS